MLMKALKTALVAVCCAFPAYAASDSAKNEDIVVATVNGKPIYYADVVFLQQSHPQLSRLPIKDLYPSLLDMLIDTTLAHDAAVKAKLDKKDAVEKRIQNAVRQMLAAAYVEDTIEKNLTKEELSKMYNQYLRDNPPQEGMEAAHILVKSKEEAEDIISKLKKGEDFAKLANEHSIDKAAHDGELGLFTRELMVREFSDAAFAMKEGEISKTPVKTQYGYHVIKAGKRQMIEPPSFEEMENELTQMYRNTAASDILKSLRSDAKITKQPFPEK